MGLEEGTMWASCRITLPGAAAETGWPLARGSTVARFRKLGVVDVRATATNRHMTIERVCSRVVLGCRRMNGRTHET